MKMDPLPLRSRKNMCLERKRKERKIVPRVNGDEAREREQGEVSRCVCACTHTHTLKLWGDRRKGSREAVGKTDKWAD